MHSNNTFASLTPLQRLCALSHSLDKHNEDELLIQLTPLHDVSAALVRDDVVHSPTMDELFGLMVPMHALDQAFEIELGYRRHVYILGDDTVAKTDPRNNRLAIPKRRNRLLELLSTLGLIYRFNVAPKFEHGNDSTMQLRLNGWGRIVVSTFKVTDSERYKQVFLYLRESVQSSREDYLELLNKCNSEERPLKVDRIKELQEAVPIQIVT